MTDSRIARPFAGWNRRMRDHGRYGLQVGIGWDPSYYDPRPAHRWSKCARWARAA